MLTLVLANNYLLMFVGWEGVGLCSYLLIGFWFTRKSAADAGKKAFIVNRIGDFGFILASLLIFWTFERVDFQTVFQRAGDASLFAVEPLGTVGVLTAICLLLFLGATGKSAQIPLYVWLPDAMEGPTPVSALIHAATMVTAGVYMVARSHVLFDHAPGALLVVAVIGAVDGDLCRFDRTRSDRHQEGSGLFHGQPARIHVPGLRRRRICGGYLPLDDPRVLQSAAVSRRGQRHPRDGRNSGYSQDGRIASHMPWTYRTFLVGTLAIAGIPGLAGFFSKDAILGPLFTVRTMESCSGPSELPPQASRRFICSGF